MKTAEEILEEIDRLIAVEVEIGFKQNCEIDEYSNGRYDTLEEVRRFILSEPECEHEWGHCMCLKCGKNKN